MFNDSTVEEFAKLAGVNKDVALGALMATTGGLVLLSPRAQNQLVGLKRVFHGANPANIDAIRESGLLSQKGGTGASEVHSKTFSREDTKDYRETSKGLVHVTPVKGVARGYAAFHVAPFGESAKQRSRAMFTGTLVPGVGEKGVITADLPRELYDRFEKDTDSSIMGIPTPALKGAIDVDPEYIKGSKKYNRLKLLKDQAKDIKSYAADDPKGFMLGLGAMAAGAGLTALGGKKIIKNLSKVGSIVDLSNQPNRTKFEQFSKRKDVYGHRTPHAESVLSSGKLISALEALQKGKIKSVELGKGVGSRKEVSTKAELGKDQLDKLQDALLVNKKSDVDKRVVSSIATENKMDKNQVMAEFLRRRRREVKHHLNQLGNKAEDFRQEHLSIPKLGPNIFVTKGGIMNEPSYGDVSMLVRTQSAEESPFANTLTNEHIIAPRKAMEYRNVNVQSGYVIAPKNKIKGLNKKFPKYKFVEEEQIPNDLKKELYVPTRSASELTRRVIPKFLKGELRLVNK